MAELESDLINVDPDHGNGRLGLELSSWLPCMTSVIEALLLLLMTVRSGIVSAGLVREEVCLRYSVDSANGRR